MLSSARVISTTLEAIPLIQLVQRRRALEHEAEFLNDLASRSKAY